ncbi:hypothetical protein KIN20_020642 [Parelaphostrongylus tenuis]|uniref:Uncharacterized protein n=1 Tax=Parelaphostrongylus tenuis TaxID=148309 RepID=A0AAD5N4C3_PARTN|nr:hypothetical protein KIN20_020642 [Parelaphostrongylus tenuis]
MTKKAGEKCNVGDEKKVKSASLPSNVTSISRTLPRTSSWRTGRERCGKAIFNRAALMLATIHLHRTSSRQQPLLSEIEIELQCVKDKHYHLIDICQIIIATINWQIIWLMTSQGEKHCVDGPIKK